MGVLQEKQVMMDIHEANIVTSCDCNGEHANAHWWRMQASRTVHLLHTS